MFPHDAASTETRKVQQVHPPFISSTLHPTCQALYDITKGTKNIQQIPSDATSLP